MTIQDPILKSSKSEAAADPVAAAARFRELCAAVMAEWVQTGYVTPLSKVPPAWLFDIVTAGRDCGAFTHEEAREALCAALAYEESEG